MATIQGLYITVFGMAILFVALLILMLAAMGLERLFRPKELEKGKPSNREKELVAAIAVAIALKLKAESPKLYPILNTCTEPRRSVQYPTPERAPSPWRFLGRHRQLMSSQRVKGRRQ